jgi:pimeloyl-ACP methyl ester carboxylesterase
MSINYKIINPNQKRTVVYLHGFLESLTMWRNLPLEEMPFRSILIDLPGHGKSALNEIPKDDNKLEKIALLLKHFLENLGIHEYDIIGHSLGGYVAIEMHKLNNDKLQKIVLMHSNFWEDDEQKKSDRNRVIQVVKSNKSFFIKEAIPNLFLEEVRTTDFVQELIKEALLIDKTSIIFYSEAMRDRLSNEKHFVDHNKNFHIVQGEMDKIVPKEKMNMYQIINYHEINNAGHMGHFENQKEIANFLRKF